MAPTEKTGKAKKPAKKEKIFHPESRKAGQLARTQLRKTKLADAASKRLRKNAATVDKYGFFFHAIPPEDEVEALDLEDLHTIVRDVWLVRHDAELERERAARRKGRPQSAIETQLEGVRQAEWEEYQNAGLEVPDLTHKANVTLFRRWDGKEAAFLDLLRYVRISSAWPEKAVVTRPGKHQTLVAAKKEEDAGKMDTSA